jgi:NAD(P)-dependent dehydrogenase (short-subunit alcohol dehydrogenase family)
VCSYLSPCDDDVYVLTTLKFNNAGIMHPKDDHALNTEEKIWDLTMQVNVKGVWWGSKYAILAMRENKADPEKGLTQGGSIINTASFVAIMGAATPQLACTSVVAFLDSWMLGR